MKKLMLVCALLIGCQADSEPGASADDAVAVAAPAKKTPERLGARMDSALTGTIWVRADSTSVPGALRLFLTNGTLLMDSCWETYRFSAWTAASDSTLRWQEDGAEIRADVLTLNEEELTLRLNVTSGPDEQRFVAASVPYVCPDMPR